MIETIDNQDPHRQQESNNLVNSIIPSKVVLKGELETGATWTETFEYNGQTYEAINQLTVQTSEAGVTQYRVDTTVKDMPGYIQPDYVETRIYEEGKGLVSFTNLQPLSQFDEDYPKDYPEVEFYQFGYKQTGVQQASDQESSWEN